MRVLAVGSLELVKGTEITSIGRAWPAAITLSH
jgi:hypothetical protein